MAPLSDPDPSTIDFYDLLSIPPNATASEIRRAYRKASLLYHPDKVTPTPETLSKFQLLQTAITVLLDEAEKSKYDASREAKLRRVAENAALEGRRRKMKEELERRETTGEDGVSGLGVKRAWSERELEIKRIAEENRRRREKVVARKVEEAKVQEQEQRERQDLNGAGNEDAVQRSVKVRWVKEGEGLDVDDQALVEMFSAGEVEDVVMLKDKKRRLEGRDRKVVMGTAVLVFKSLAMAKKVVANGKTEELESVAWAAGKEKDIEPS